MRLAVWLFTFFILLLSIGAAFSDEVTLKDGSRIKGVVVEDYADRLIFSTYEGEKTIIKSDIAGVEYNSLEDNLLNLAGQYQDKGDAEKAYYYYKKAYILNPESKAAEDGVILCRQLMMKSDQALQKESVRKQEAIESFRRTGEMPQDTEKDKERILKEEAGIVIRMEQSNPEIAEVLKGSSANISGLAAGDKIVSIWSRLAGYLTKEEILTRLTNSDQAEIKFSIERKISVKKKKAAFNKKIISLIGAAFTVRWEGITVEKVLPDTPSYKAGLKEGDLITAIEGRPTRYMDLKIFNKLITEAKGNITFNVNRDISIWKRI